MAYRVFFHLRSEGSRCRRLLAVSQQHGGGEETRSQVDGGQGNRRSSPLHCVSTRCRHRHEPQPVPPANIRDAAQGATGVVKDAAGRVENQKAQARGGDAAQVTKAGGFETFESPDGKFVFYSKAQTPGIWSAPIEGGQEVPVLVAVPDASLRVPFLAHVRIRDLLRRKESSLEEVEVDLIHSPGATRGTRAARELSTLRSAGTPRTQRLWRCCAISSGNGARSLGRRTSLSLRSCSAASGRAR